MNKYLGFGLLIIVALVAIYFLPYNNRAPQVPAEVNDFVTCAQAGYPVAESYPARCTTPDGRVFVEEISENPEVVVNTPSYDQVVASPLRVTGRARGNWFFEANLPVTLKDESGRVLAQVGAQAIGEWMTEDFVDFTAELRFTAPVSSRGFLIVEKDNPSGLPENAGSFAVPVRFR